MLLNKLLKRLIYRIRGDHTTEQLVEWGLVIGRNFSREEGCIIDPSHCWLIRIGDDVTLAPRVHILAHDASMYSAVGYTRIEPVLIGNNVFVGADTIILPGVTIGDNVVIGAGSVVTRDIPSDSVAVGQPARVIKTYTDFIDQCREKMETVPLYGAEYTLRNKHLTPEMKRQMFEELSRDKGGFVK